MTNNNIKERIFDVFWEGPFDDDNLDDDANCVIYMICGTHGLYGRNVPLYIGKTGTGSGKDQRTVKKRIAEHKASWINSEPDPVKIYTASISEFKSWDFNSKKKEYSPPDDVSIIDAVEALLIYSHQPVYNQRSKLSPNDASATLRLFNTGRRSSLYPEVSGKYYVEQ